VGFSRTNGLEFLEFFLMLFEAWRMIVPEVMGVGDRDSRVLHIVPLWGSRKRGIADMLSILFYSTREEHSLKLSNTRRKFSKTVRQTFYVDLGKHEMQIIRSRASPE